MIEIHIGTDSVVRLWRDGEWIIIHTKAVGAETTVSLTFEQFAALREFHIPKFKEVFCSNCGGAFGPGDHGFSHCEDHALAVARAQPITSSHPV